MKKLLCAASLALGLASLPVAAAAQAPQACPAGDANCEAEARPSAFTALDLRRELGLTDAQATRLEAVRAALRESHRVHCAPMHASKPTPEEEERHHAEMKEINDRAEAEASAVLSSTQLASLARIHAARPKAEGGKETGSHAGHHRR